MSITRRHATVFPYRGKWRIQYLDLFGKTRTITADSRQAAYLKLAEIEGQMRSGYLNLQTSNLPSFEQWLGYWLESRKTELNPTTWLGYEASCRLWLVPLLGKLRLDSITPRMIQDLYQHLMENHELSAGTIRRMHSLLSSAFRLALFQGVIARSPLDGVKQPKLVRKPIEVFTQDEMQKLLAAASRKAPQEHLRWLFALRYGMRQGEVLGLKFSDFDLVSKTLTIQRTVNSLPGKGVVELPTKSNNSTRTLPIDTEVVRLLSQLQGRGYLFPSDSGGAMEASVDGRKWRSLLASADVRQLPLHAARHSVATHLVGSGVNPRAVQMLLGHSSPAYTLATYVHLDVGQLRSLLSDRSESSEQIVYGNLQIASNNSE